MSQPFMCSMCMIGQGFVRVTALAFPAILYYFLFFLGIPPFFAYSFINSTIESFILVSFFKHSILNAFLTSAGISNIIFAMYYLIYS